MHNEYSISVLVYAVVDSIVASIMIYKRLLIVYTMNEESVLVETNASVLYRSIIDEQCVVSLELVD